MRKVLFVTSMALIVFLCGCATVPTMENAPADFRGIAFGTSIKNIPDMTIIYEDGDVAKCSRVNENLEMFGAQIDNVYYKFFQGKFYEGQVYFKERKNFSEIRAKLQSMHGTSLQQRTAMLGLVAGTMSGNYSKVPTESGPAERATWYGKDVYITLEYVSGEGSLIYDYVPILQKVK